MAFLRGDVALKLIKAEQAKLFEFLFLFYFFSYMDNSLPMIKFGTCLLKSTLKFGEERLRDHLVAHSAFLSQA